MTGCRRDGATRRRGSAWTSATSRIGVARSDPDATIATPVETVPAGAGSVARLVALAAEHDALEVVVGLPRSLSGREGPAATRSGPTP